MPLLTPGKLNLILDGQFGSTGKGNLAGYLASTEHADIFVGELSPNAGHTCRDRDGLHIVTKQLPVGLVLTRRSVGYLSAGSIIDPAALLAEMDHFGIDHDRIAIHPSAAIITAADKEFEADETSSVAQIGSTGSGTGSALANKVLRRGPLAKDCPELAHLVHEFDLSWHLKQGCTALMETSQGVGLGINSGFYPHCTSREKSTAQALSDARVHPRLLGKVFMTLRTYPIRVGNRKEAKGGGYSGDFYPDSTELTWEELQQQPELTTVTKRIRRVATFSVRQFHEAVELVQPDVLFLNFVNYVGDIRQLREFGKMMAGYKVLLGLGPNIEDIYVLSHPSQIGTFTGLIK